MLPFFGGPVGAGALWTGPAIAASAVGAVILLATASAAVSLRRVRLTPLGVRRRSDAPPRRTAVLVGCAALVAVVGGAGASLATILGTDAGSRGPAASDAILFADMRTGVLVWLSVQATTPIVTAIRRGA